VTRHTEIDDIHLRSCTTPSSVTVPTALALTREAGDFDPDQVGSAIWIGTELMTRLGMAIDGPRVLYRGLWPTYFAAPFAAAAIAARIWRLSEEATAHALSLALMLGAGRSGRFQGRVPGRSVILALAVASGVRAAAAARDGVGGDPDLLDGPWLPDAQGLDSDTTALTTNLREGNDSIYAALSLKPFCSAKQAIAAVEALTQLIDAGVPPDAITQVRVRVPPPFVRMISTKAEPGVRSSTIVSAPFQMGLAAFCRPRLYDIERAGATDDARVTEFSRNVEIVGDDALLDGFPACWPAEVEVSAGGSVSRKRVDVAFGDPERPLDEGQLRDKAQRVLGQLGEARPGSGAALIELGLRALQDKDACRAMADTMWQACGLP
jgi:2-methylcitrate dehydratase PrpD